MAVYVDPLIDYGWKLGPSCHMTADTLDELNEFALKIGLKKEWIDISAKGMPHYDLVKSKRDLAVKNGAIEITRREARDKYLNYLTSRKGIK